MAISAFSLCVFLASDHGYLLNVRSQSAKQGLDEEKKTDTLTDLRNIFVCLFIFALILFNLFLIFLKGLGEGVHTHTHLRIEDSCDFCKTTVLNSTHIDCTIYSSLYSEIQQGLNFTPCSGMALLA